MEYIYVCYSQAAVHLGQDYTENLQSTKSQPLKSVRQLFQTTARPQASGGSIWGDHGVRVHFWTHRFETVPQIWEASVKLVRSPLEQVQRRNEQILKCLLSKLSHRCEFRFTQRDTYWRPKNSRHPCVCPSQCVGCLTRGRLHLHRSKRKPRLRWTRILCVACVRKIARRHVHNRSSHPKEPLVLCGEIALAQTQSVRRLNGLRESVEFCVAAVAGLLNLKWLSITLWLSTTLFLRKTSQESISLERKSYLDCSLGTLCTREEFGRVTYWLQTLRSWKRWTQQKSTPKDSMQRK